MARMPIVEPKDWQPLPQSAEHINMTIIFGTATLRAAVPKPPKDALQEFRSSRQAARNFIVNGMMKNKHLDQETGNTMLMAAVCIALTSECGEALQIMAEEPGFGMTYHITPLGTPNDCNWRLSMFSGE
jgi:hypothetical protein